MITFLTAALLVSTTPPTLPIPDDYAPLIDDTGTIVIAVPETWTEINTVPAVNDDQTERPFISASPDFESFQATFDTPGVIYTALPLTDDLLAVVDTYGLTSGCETIEVREYDDPDFLGYIQIGLECGSQLMTWNMVVANPIDPGAASYTVVVQVQSTDDTERQTILRTFNFPEQSASVPTT